jgi:tRNA A-37 threonylcarbamoyl transferase component Bud32
MKRTTMGSFRKISDGEFKGWVRKYLVSFLRRDFLTDPVAFIERLNGQVIKSSRLRWAAIFDLSEKGKIFVKRDRTKGWSEMMKYLFLPSKGRKEWFIAYQLQKKNLNVPSPVGWVEKGRWGLVKESYYLSEAIGSGTSLIDFLHSGMKVAIESLAKKVKAFHDAGLFHKDLHGGNFLWDGETFFLTDLHRAEILRSVSLDQRLQNLSHLFHSLRSHWGREDFLRFLKEYFGEESLDCKELKNRFQKVLASIEHLQRRWRKSRTRRCLKESTSFYRERGREMVVYRRRDFPMDRVEEALRRHRALTGKTSENLLKQAPESLVSLVQAGDTKICVKEFRYPHWIDRLKENFRYPKGLKAWIAGNGLKVRDVASPGVMAYAERGNGFAIREGFLLMEASKNGKEMDRHLFKGFESVQRKRLFITAFARWLSGIHAKEIFHRDMKACNIFVYEEGEGWCFQLLDLEDVRLDKRVKETAVFRTLLQLNTSIPKGITHTDRMRFYVEYCRHHPMIQDRKSFLSKLIQKSKKRGVVYVTPQGIVEEKWS